MTLLGRASFVSHVETFTLDYGLHVVCDSIEGSIRVR